MKTLFLLLIVLLMVVCNSTAQEINYGLSVGYNKTIGYNLPMSIFRVDRTNVYNHYNVRAILEFTNPSDIRIQTGLRYMQIGYDHDIDPDPNVRYFTGLHPTKVGADYSYLSIPLSAYYFLPFVTGFYLGGGLERVYLLSASEFTVNNNGKVFRNDYKGSNGHHFSMYTIGIGFEYQLDNLSLFIQPEYSHGIGDASNNTYSIKSVFSEQIAINVGIKY